MSGPITELREGNATIAVFRSELKHLNESNVAIIEQKLMELIETLRVPEKPRKKVLKLLQLLIQTSTQTLLITQFQLTMIQLVQFHICLKR